jgi:hypothetical protein
MKLDRAWGAILLGLPMLVAVMLIAAFCSSKRSAHSTRAQHGWLHGEQRFHASWRRCARQWVSISLDHAVDLLAWLGLILSVACENGVPANVWTLGWPNGDPRRVLRVQADEPGVAWSPDARFLAVFTTSALSVVRAERRRTARTGRAGGCGGLEWAPWPDPCAHSPLTSRVLHAARYRCAACDAFR